MTRQIVKMLKAVVCAAVVLSCLIASSPARAQVAVEVEVFPPPAFIATAVPVYHEGRAAYWYRNRWYYREGRAWRYYHVEPVYLREYRGRYHEHFRPYYYGRAHEGGYRHYRW